MALEKDLEQLDDFLSNRLTGEEKEAFKQKLGGDSALKQEQNFQHNLIEGIKAARAAELKSLLNNTPIPAPLSETALFTKVAAWCVVAGLLGTGVYYFLHKEEVNEPTEQPAAGLQDQEEQSKESVEEPSSTNEQKSIAIQAPLTTETKNTETKRKTSKIKEAPAQKEEKVAEKRKLEVFDPTHENNANSEPRNAQQVQSASGNEIISSSITVETDNTNKKYTFHYQFKNESLFLYGSFEKNLYEILEFFNENKRTVFLYYKDNYYLLNESNEKIKPLAAISDSVLVKKLREYRTN